MYSAIDYYTSSVSFADTCLACRVYAPLRSIQSMRPPDALDRSALNVCHWHTAPSRGKQGDYRTSNAAVSTWKLFGTISHARTRCNR